MISTSTSKYVADKFFSYINDKKLPYVIIGNPSDFLERGKDWDLFTIQYDEFFSAIKEFCELENLSIVNIIHHATGIKFYFSPKAGKDKSVVISGPDALFFPTGQIKGDIGLSMAKLLQSPKFDEFGYLIPSPKYSFIFLLIKKIDKGTLTANHGKYLSRLSSENPEGVRKLINKFWDPHYAELLIRSTESGCWEKAIQSTSELRDQLRKKTTWSSKRAVWILKRLYLRFKYPAGLSVVLLGPDGSGKTSATNKLISLITRPFFGTNYVHGAGFYLRTKVLNIQMSNWWNRINSSLSSHGKNEKNDVIVTRPFKTRAQAPHNLFVANEKNDVIVTRPLKSHAQPSHNLIVSLVKLLYLWLDCCVGWWLVVWPKLFRNKLVSLDRYYHDILIDPQRYRYSGPMWLARWLGKLIPKPDLWIFLDVPAEILQTRKQDVSFEESVRQRDEYRKLFGKIKNGIIVDGTQSLDDVVADVNHAMVDFMTKRTEDRFLGESES